MRRCSSKTELQLLHPTSIKLQRKHHGKDSTKTVQPQEKQGQSWRATRWDGAVEWKSFSLNKQRRDGSHNHREAVGGWHIWAAEAKLWSCVQRARLTKVLIERPLPYVHKGRTIPGLMMWTQSTALSLMYQPTPGGASTRSAYVLVGNQWEAEECSVCCWGVRTMYRFNTKLVTVRTRLRDINKRHNTHTKKSM